MVRRFSSRRRATLGQQFLQDRLNQAVQYDRIAGYFSSSILEIAGEAIEQMPGQVRMICNSDLDHLDVQAANAVLAMTQEWKQAIDQLYNPKLKVRLQRLHDLLASGKLSVRVLPNQAFGLIHGKAGVITFHDGTQTSFLGSANASRSAWELNYELIWEDDSPEAIAWVQAEFDALWSDTRAIPLTEAVIQDVKRLSQRQEVGHDTWRRQAPEPAAAVVESPIYRRHYGLWDHQKYFVQRAFQEHVSGRGARFVLADQVGLGKTIQMALAAMLMALHGENPVLVIAPKTLVRQWQDELMQLLDLPSAYWNGKNWVDEHDLVYPNRSPEAGILDCPRRVGIISQGLIVRGSDMVQGLLSQRYECVIVDEAHRSRRRNLAADKEAETAEPNNLMRYLMELSRRTKSMILGTATPVQLYRVEAYDLLSVLAQGSDHVLGNPFSKWRQNGNRTIAFQLVDGTAKITGSQNNRSLRWEWIRNPFPPAEEDHYLFGTVRDDLDLKPTEAVLKPEQIDELSPFVRDRVDEKEQLFLDHNPYVRHIIRRTRKYLETTINPETGDPYLKPIHVELLGEQPQDAILLPSYLHDAYAAAEEFCQALGALMKGAGFIKTLLLRRMGSSLQAGKLTAQKMMGEGPIGEVYEEDDDPEDSTGTGIAGRLGAGERKILERLIYSLDQYQEKDPKLSRLRDLLFKEGWMEPGCIVFSQYLDTITYFSEQIALEHPELVIGVYAGANRSGLWMDGQFIKRAKDDLKAQVQAGEIRLLFGTDAASEGLNLQRLGTLINLDLPWNPTRLEQRKGRIQRIGQRLSTVKVYNMRYKDSVEDRVHELLSERLQGIYNIFGQIPDVLEDVWIDAALGEIDQAKQRIQEISNRSPFEERYDRKIEAVDFETCTEVLSQAEIQELMKRGW